MKDLCEQEVGTTGFVSLLNAQPFATQESAPLNKEVQSKRKLSSLRKDTRKRKSFMTSDPVSTSSAKHSGPYWNSRCEEIQSKLWLPHKIGSQGSDFRSSDSLSNITEVLSNFWKKAFRPKISTPPSLLRILHHFAIPKVDAETVSATRRIRIYPRSKADEAEFFEIIRQQNRAYNLAIASFKEADEHVELRKSEDLKAYNLRAIIREYVRDEVIERGQVFRSADLDEAVMAADKTRKAVIKKRSAGLPAGYSFKSRKDPRQGFVIQKLNGAFLKKFRSYEKLPTDQTGKPEAFGKMTNFIYENGQWFGCFRKTITTASRDEIQVPSVVAIDPGVRCFATSYSNTGYEKYGEGFMQNKIFPLLLQLDDLIGKKAVAKNDEKKRHFTKRAFKIKVRIRNLIDDLHRRTAHDLVLNHDLILLPSFETKGMSNKSTRKIRTKTVRSMLGLAHYRFKQHLQWMCKKYGKVLVCCNEAYTSKTRSWDGVIVNNLGAADFVTDGKIIVDRDVNGARGIFLKFLTSGHAA